jgi:hypothetical protein
MSYFVTATFDLNRADASAYRKIYSDLKRIDFSKVITGRKRIRKLPANTFFAEFDNDDFDRSSEVCAYAGKEIVRIFKKNRVVGNYFVSAGRRWAWKKGSSKMG